ncbi:MAG: hypothetical protein ACTSQH_04015 [Candidatus Hodarchaeales archaeon]
MASSDPVISISIKPISLMRLAMAVRNLICSIIGLTPVNPIFYHRLSQVGV